MVKNLEDRFTKPRRTRVPGDQVLLDYQSMAHAIIQQLNGGKFDSNSKRRAKHFRYVESLIARTTGCIVAEDRIGRLRYHTCSHTHLPMA